MKLQTYLMAQPMVQRYADRYHAPLIKYEHFVPSKHWCGWLSTRPTPEEMAFYHIGVQNRRPGEMPYVLSAAEKYHGVPVPVVEGVLTADYWEQWAMDNAAALLDEKTNFVNGRGF